MTRPALNFLLGMAALASCAMAQDAKREVTTARELRALSPERAAERLPAHLRAVVTFVEAHGTVFLYDGTGATFAAAKSLLRFPASLGLKPGQLLDLNGVTYPGLYVPGIEVQAMKIIGSSDLPAPRPVDFEQLASGRFNYEWVEARGIIRAFRVVDSQAELKLALGDGRIEILANTVDAKEAEGLIDAAVRVQGLAAGFINDHRQLVAPHLRIQDLSAIHVEESAPADPFLIESTPASRLLRFNPNGSPGHRVKVKGVVTHQMPGEAVFLRADNRGLRVQTAQTGNLQSGDDVDVLGFPEMGAFSAVLRDAVFQRSSHAGEPEPVALKVKAILSGAHDDDLVRLEADLVDTEHSADDLALLLRSDNTVFRARLSGAGSSEVGELRPGSHLRLTGVAVAEPTELRATGFRASPRSFVMLLRSARDVEILRKAPWWTVRRLAALLGAVFVLALGAFAWAATLRRRVAWQTAVIARKMKAEAATEERERIAREFHDTLEQELVGLMLRLDAAAARIEGPKFRALIDDTRNLVHNIQRGARSLVSNLREHALVNESLAEMISRTVSDLRTGREIAVRTEGERYSLSGLLAHELLRIAQEAVTNAVKHGAATRIDITLAFAPEEVRLRIEDNGCGFSPADEVGKPGHFGLLGMRERVQKLGGQLLLESQPDHGAVIEAVAPAPGGNPVPLE